jgi:hypothetical protein
MPAATERSISPAAVALGRKLGLDPQHPANRVPLGFLTEALAKGYPECCAVFHLAIWVQVVQDTYRDHPEDLSMAIYNNYMRMMKTCVPKAIIAAPCPACCLAGRALPEHDCADCKAGRPHSH